MVLTTTRFRVLPYSPYSNSARLLAEALGGKRIKLESSRYQYREGDVVINWGNSSLAEIGTLNNDTNNLTICSNKLLFFQHNEGQDWLPEFWTNPEEIPDNAFPIVCRTTLTGHSGHGIVISDTRDDLVPCQLYVKYVPKKEEYRIHVGRNPEFNHWGRTCPINCSGGCSTCAPDEHDIPETVIIAIQQKKRRLDYDEPNWKVRNHANGFVYAREGVDPPAGVLGVAMDCLLRSGLDFGAVDVGYHPEYGPRVYEINTAPGLEGQTLDDYVNYFKGFM
jgi:hypothetical protein